MLRQRMYSFVIYQLSGIQAGIQAGHAWMEYAKNHFNDEDFQQWIKNDKTVIILNGGTTNNDIDYNTGLYGGINEILYKLHDLGIKAEPFYEPDLNDAMTAIAFLVDEMVWDQEKYPLIKNNVLTGDSIFDRDKEIYLNVQKYGKDFEKSYELREFLSNYSLARN